MGTIAKPYQVKADDAIIFLGKSAMLRVQNLGISGGFDREEIKQLGFDKPIDHDKDLGASMTFDANSWGTIDGLAQLLARQPAATPLVNQCDAQGGAVGVADDPANYITMKSYRDSANRRVDVVVPIREEALFQRSIYVPNQRMESFDYTYSVDGVSTENYGTSAEEGDYKVFMGKYKDLRAERADFFNSSTCQFQDTAIDIADEGTKYLIAGVSVNGEQFWRGGHYDFLVSGSPANYVHVKKDGEAVNIMSSGDRVVVAYVAIQGGGASDLRVTWADVMEATHPTADSKLDIDAVGIGKIQRGQVELYYYNRHSPSLDDFADSDVTDVTSTSIFEGNTDLSSSNDTYDDYQIMFITGVNAGVYRFVSGYVGATRQITVASAFPAEPAVGDTFVLSSNAVSPHLATKCQTVNITGDLTGEGLLQLGEMLPYANDIEDGVGVSVTFLDSDLEEMAEMSGRPTAEWTNYKDDTKNLFLPPGVEKNGQVEVGTSTSVFTGDAALSAVNDYYNGMSVRFNGGENTDIARTVTDYVGATKTFTFADPFPNTPAHSDNFQIFIDVLRAGVLSMSDFFRSVNSKAIDNTVVVYVYKDKQKTVLLKIITVPQVMLSSAEPVSLSIDGRNATQWGFTAADVFITSDSDGAGTVNTPFD